MLTVYYFGKGPMSKADFKDGKKKSKYFYAKHYDQWIFLPSTQLQQKMCFPEDLHECQMPCQNLLLQ